MAKQPKTESFLDFCDKLAPCIVRAMAIKRNGRKTRLKSAFEIAADSGLPPRTVQRIGSARSWTNIRLGTASKFLHGCGVDMINRDGLMEKFLVEYADKGMPHMDFKQKKFFAKLMDWPGI